MNLKEKLETIDLRFDDIFYDRCEKYTALLQQWGKIHNLTASLKTEEIENNIVDSVYPIKFLDNFDSLADVGTGAGYPGMLLAIARPKSKVVLVEPRAKRVAFLNFVKSALKLENVLIEQKRIEDLQDETFDIITSRAVTNTTLLLDLTSHLKDANVQNAEVFKVGEHRNFLYMRNKEK